ncbi:MAG: regulator of sigma E protease [Candidatus Azotimanducaceae bacterium]|jgi:regulator of sigma E protease
MQETLIKAAQFFMSLSLLIVLHELGHFIPAKLFKTRVEKFYLFFDPWFSLVKKKVGGTEYGIGWLPLGGYVKIAGMVDESMDKDQMDEEPKDWEFRSKPAWQRLIILIGGVTVNVLVAFIIYAGSLAYWGEEYLPNESVIHGIEVDSTGKTLGFENGDFILSVNNTPVENFNAIPIEIALQEGGDVQVLRNNQQITVSITTAQISSLIKSPRMFTPRTEYLVSQFVEGSVAQAAGLMAGDKLVGINGQPLRYFDEYLKAVPTYANDSIVLSAQRGNSIVDLDILVPATGKLGVYREIQIDKMFELSKKEYGFFEAIPAGFKKAGTTLSNYLRQFKLIFNPETEAYKSVGGFLTIGSQFPGVWNWQFFWNFTAFLSIMLAFLNILPIPALDGGHVVFVLYEMVSGRKPNQKVMEYAQMVGFFILLALILVVNGKDVIEKFF